VTFGATIILIYFAFLSELVEAQTKAAAGKLLTQRR
jgi:hypothetical protein